MNKIKLYRPIWLLFPCVIFLLFSLAYYLGYRVNVSGSLPFFFFRVIPLSSSKEIKRNDFIVLPSMQIPHSSISIAAERHYISSRYLLLKEIAGIPGDTVLIKDDKIFINDVSRPLFIISEDSKGRILTPFPTPLVLEDNFYWLISNPQGGFDSRYFGPVNCSIFLYRAFPIF